MIVYVGLFSVVALLAAWQAHSPDNQLFGKSSRRSIAVCVWLMLTLVVGLRQNVGGDWYDYLRFFERIRTSSLIEAFGREFEPGYSMLNVLAVMLQANVNLVNLVLAAVFCGALVYFCLEWPSPWLGLAVSVPYLVVVVGMGYTRQSVAIGLILLALVWSWRHRSRWIGAAVLIVLASLFHRTALLVVALGLVLRFGLQYRRWVLSAALSTVILVFVAFPYLAEQTFHLYYNYLDQQIVQSRGTAARAALTALAGLTFLLLRRRLALPALQDRTLLLASWVALGLLTTALVMPSSTAVDRVGLYLLPLQIAVWSVVPSAFANRPRLQRGVVAAVLATYGAMLLVWLHLSPFARFWVPYRWAPPW